MLSGVLKCFLVIFLTCASFASLDARATNIRDSPITYVKPFSHHSETKSGVHNYNKDGDGCSKCKWENDDYWERDEPEEEGDENDGDECGDDDNGQYRPDKTHHHGKSGSRGHTSGSHPPEVHKIGPTGVYGDNVIGGNKENEPDGPFGATNFPGNTGYAESTSGYKSTPRPGSIWNTPFAGKPTGYDGAIANTFVTTPSYGPGTGWNRGTTSAGYGSTLKSAWGSGHGDTFAGNFGTTPSPTWNNQFPSSQKPGLSWNAGHDNTPAGSYGNTPKPGTSWNTGIGAPTSRFPTSQKPGASWNSGHDGTTVRSYGTTPKPGHERNTGFPGILTTESPFSRKPAPNWNSDYSNIPVGSFGTTSKPGSNWNVKPSGPTAEFPLSQKPVTPWNTGRDDTPIGSFESTVSSVPNQNIGFGSKPESNWNQRTPVDTSGCTQPDRSCGQGNHGPIKLGATPVDSSLVKSNESPISISHGTSHGVSDIFSPSNPNSPNEYQNGPHDQFGATGIQDNTFDSEKSPQSPTGDNIHRPPGVFKPSYGTGTTATNSWPSASHAGTHPHAGFPITNPGFGTDKPFNYMNRPGSSGAYGNPTQKPATFNVPCCGATANANANAFGTSFGTYNTPGSPSTHTGSSNYPGVKDSFGGARPIYGTGPLGMPDGKTEAWPSNQPGDGGRTWPGKQPDNRSEIKPGTQPGGGNVPWLSKQPESNITPGEHPGSGVGTWPGRKPGDGSNAWPGIVLTQQPGRGSGPTWSGGQAGHENSPGTQPGSGNAPWLNKQPESNITPGEHPGSGVGTWPGRKPGDGSNAWPGIAPTQQPEHGSGPTWPGGQAGHENSPGTQPGGGNAPWLNKQPESNITPGEHPGSGVGTWPGRKPGGGSNAWPGIAPTQQPGHGNPTWHGGQAGHENSPGTQPGGGNAPWLNKQPESNITPGEHPGSGVGTWPDRTPGSGSNAWPGIMPTQQPGHGVGTWPGRKPGDGSNAWPGIAPTQQPGRGSGPTWPGGQAEHESRPGTQPGGGNAPWLSKQSESNITPGEHPGSGVGTWPDRKPGDGSNAWPGIAPTQQPGRGSGPTWSGGQVGHGSTPGCSSGNCEGPSSGSSNCERNYNCGDGCSERSNNAPATHGPCVISGPSSVNKTYYPAGTGDGNVPNIINTYKPDSLPNIGSGKYPGVNTECGRDNSCNQGAGGTDVTPEGVVQWNPANPFLFGSAGRSNNFGQTNSGSWSSSRAQNQGRPNSWASSGASAFASSSAGSWSGSYPVDVKG